MTSTMHIGRLGHPRQERTPLPAHRSRQPVLITVGLAIVVVAALLWRREDRTRPRR
jgi:hypothetical protein